ncbi:hypothetical protein RvY_02661 [Ramazzottius varieornatus]|uniref:acetylcholinesterase n=1 Tax=Ramazzottius varieornatus TaxID=947166 RepID=A0A1D1ULA4_RAMVA|nr:hypothetical protein RvY_02661 [Ramazzottius varieornatus]
MNFHLTLCFPLMFAFFVEYSREENTTDSPVFGTGNSTHLPVDQYLNSTQNSTQDEISDAIVAVLSTVDVLSRSNDAGNYSYTVAPNVYGTVGTVKRHAVNITGEDSSDDEKPEDDKEVPVDENEVVPNIDQNEVVPEKVNLEDLTLVNSTLGYIRGRSVVAPNGKSVDEYLGIPFAEPPVGQLRFRKPVPKKKWEGIHNAWTQPNSCMQIIDTYLGDFSGSTMWNANTRLSEDCLYLNIWVPKPPPTNAPVMVWIYGGGFFSGTITLDVYNGTILASEENIIIVSIQYRLGPFGFFYFGTDETPGNQGLHDQLLALKWIQENIEHFGGHPKYVTLFGESAGAACVGLHLLSPLSSPLFMQAILQSGAPTAEWVSVSAETAMNRTLDFIHRVDCTPEPPDAAMECLRQIDAQMLVDDIPATGNVFDYYFNPVVDGDFLPKSAEELVKFGAFKRTNILLGTTANEGSNFLVYIFPEVFQLYREVRVSRSEFTEAVFKLFPKMDPMTIAALTFEYTEWTRPDDSANLVDNLEKMVGDKSITCDALELATAYSAAGSGVFFYEFAHRSSNTPWPAWMGVHHMHEIEYVFGRPLLEKLRFTEEEKNLTRKVMNYWANFARTGNPGLSNSGEFSTRFWPVYTPDGKDYLRITAEGEMVRHGLRARHCAFWKKYVPDFTRSIRQLEAATVGTAKVAHCTSSKARSLSSDGFDTSNTEDAPDLLEVEDEWALEFQEWKRDHSVWKREFQKYMDTLENARKLVLAPVPP